MNESNEQRRINEQKMLGIFNSFKSILESKTMNRESKRRRIKEWCELYRIPKAKIMEMIRVLDREKLKNNP